MTIRSSYDRVARGLWFLSLSLVSFAVTSAEIAYDVEIQGTARVSEGSQASFALFVPDRPVHERDSGGSTPIQTSVTGGPLYAAWQSPLKIRWDFGDGSPPVMTGDRVSAAHIYTDNGNYSVTATASDHRGEFASDTHQIEVVNRDPRNIRVAYTVVDTENSIVELTAVAEDVVGDSELIYHWDFGDNDSASGADLWWTRHEYAGAGRYTVKLTVTDNDFPGSADGHERNDGKAEKTVKIRVGAGSGATMESIDGNGGDVPPTGFNATARGPINLRLSAEIRSFRGLYLQSVKPGSCRFMFSAWDDTNLAYIMGLIDLPGVAPEGSSYRIDTPNIALLLHPTAASYTSEKERWFGGANAAGVGLGGVAQQALQAATAGMDLSDEQQRMVADQLGAVGLSPEARETGETQVMPPVSSFGIDSLVSFKTDGGLLRLNFVPGARADGNFSLTMLSREKQFREQGLRIEGSINLDLVAARKDGLVRYEGCDPPPFEVAGVWPRDKTEHLRARQPAVTVKFNDQVDPESLNDDSFQVAYTNTADEKVPVAGRLMRDHNGAYLVPEAPLLPGVRYTARVKTGEGGVRSRAGVLLADDDDESWHAWEFTTSVDMVPTENSDQLLACHLYQTARDVPLIADKPAVARVYATWYLQPGVHEDYQVRTIEGRVQITDAQFNVLTSQRHTFVRPNLWGEQGIDKRTAKHTAQLTGLMPREGMQGPLAALVEVWTGDFQGFQNIYQARCPMQLWDLKPTLSIDFVALPLEGYSDPFILNAMMPTLQAIADATVENAWQQFPYAEINAGAVRKLRFPEDLEVSPLSPAPPGWGDVCGATCLLESSGRTFKEWLVSESTADVIVAFGPYPRLEQGYTGRSLRDEGGAVIITMASGNGEFFPRFVNAAVHELGHVLYLGHLPYLPPDDNFIPDRDTLDALRADLSIPFNYLGIEAQRMSRNGEILWNKSSQEGNAEGSRLFPLMFPGTIPIKEAFIANHHYRKIQQILDGSRPVPAQP